MSWCPVCPGRPEQEDLVKALTLVIENANRVDCIKIIECVGRDNGKTILLVSKADSVIPDAVKLLDAIRLLTGYDKESA